MNYIKNDILPNIDHIVDVQQVSEVNFNLIIKDHQIKLNAIIEELSNTS
jgi:hypothetical protein